MSAPPNSQSADVFAENIPLCGGCGTVIPVHAIKRCRDCGMKSYCDRDCQAVDWPIHKLFCVNRDVNQDRDKVIRAYDLKFANLLLSIALNQLGFPLYASLRGDRCLEFLPVAQAKFLEVRLQIIRDPPPQRWNRVAFVSAELVDIWRLPAERAATFIL
ncbi:hypothetical protein BDZ97DRAFT_1934962 [Flammula alnicola]|nr:hypothetical protein BDZ97DRAFT_1934962 [Flammula alnicola]